MVSSGYDLLELEFTFPTDQKIENNGEIYYNDRRHVGLQNIKKRLNLIYGEQAEFHLSNMDENFGAISEVWITQQDKK